MEFWIFVLFFSISSDALHINAGNMRSGISSSRMDTRASFAAGRVSRHYVERRGTGTDSSDNNNNQVHRETNSRAKNRPEVPLNNLQRRAGGRNRKSSKRNQTKGTKSAGDASNQPPRHQRSGSGHQLSHSTSAASLGVEGGISKPQTPSSRMPKRASGSGSQFGSFHSAEMLQSMLGGQHSPRPTHPVTGDQRLLEAQQNFIRQQPGGWVNRAMSANPNDPTATRAFGTHQGHMGPPTPLAPPTTMFSPVKQNSNKSQKSDSAMSVDMADTAQGPFRLRKMSAVGDLTMMDAWPLSRQNSWSSGSMMTGSGAGYASDSPRF